MVLNAMNMNKLLGERLLGTSGVGPRDQSVKGIHRVRQIGGLNARRCHGMGDRHVGKLVVPGGTRSGRRRPGLGGVRVHVNGLLLGDGIRKEVGMNKTEVVRVAGESHSVFVHEGGVRDGVTTSRRDSTPNGNVGRGTVVRPVTTTHSSLADERVVLGRPEHGDDGVRVSEIEGRLGRHVLEGGVLSALNLVNKDITRGITHLETLIIMNNSVVSMGVCIRQRNITTTDSGNIRGAGGNLGGSTSVTGVDDDKLLPVTKNVVDSDIVEGKGSDWKRNTGILTEPEGKDTCEVATGSAFNTSLAITGHLGNSTNHVSVADSLGSINTEVVVEVKPEVIELLNDELIERDVDSGEEVMHEVVGPTNTSIISERGGRIGSLVEDNLGDTATEPDMHHVISRTVKDRRCRVAEVNSTSRVTELNGEE